MMQLAGLPCLVPGSSLTILIPAGSPTGQSLANAMPIIVPLPSKTLAW